MIIERITNWNEAVNSARTTVRKKYITKDPSYEFKKKLVIAEHSPLRTIIYRLYDDTCDRRVALHLIRHINGTIPFLGTTRDDIVGENNKNGITFTFYFNFQSLINMSKERLCFRAASYTRNYMLEIIEHIKELDGDLLTNVLVPKCIYRGFCPESNCCGFVNTDNYKIQYATYMKYVNGD